MLGNIGRESDMRDQNRRQRGRRHAQHDDATEFRSPYMLAPFATSTQDPQSGLHSRTFPQQSANAKTGFAHLPEEDFLRGPYNLQEDLAPKACEQRDYSQYPPCHPPQYTSQNGNRSFEVERGANIKADAGRDYKPYMDDHDDYTDPRGGYNGYVQENRSEGYLGPEIQHDKYPQSKDIYDDYVRSKAIFSNYAQPKEHIDNYTKPNNGYEEYMPVNDKQYHAHREAEYDYYSQAKNENIKYGPTNGTHEEQVLSNKPPAARSSSPPPAGLKVGRLSRGGLNLFSWNTNAPKVKSPRVTHNRDEGELQRLRPQDAHVQRDKEVRDKFEGNTNSRFLCFGSDNRQQKSRGMLEGNPHSIPPAPVTIDPQPRHGRRKPDVVDPSSGEQGIAGFAGMGVRNPEKPLHIQRKPAQVSNIF